MKACTMGVGTGAERDQFRKDKRGRDRPRFSQRAAPATGPDTLWANGRTDYEDMRKRGHFTKEQLQKKNRDRLA